MEILKKLRLDKKVSQQFVADYLGITQPAYANYEAGKREPDNQTLKALAEFYGVTIDCLLGYNEVTMTAEEKELNEYLEELKNRKEMKMLFKLAKGATKEDVEKAVRIIEALRNDV